MGYKREGKAVDRYKRNWKHDRSSKTKAVYDTKDSPDIFLNNIILPKSIKDNNYYNNLLNNEILIYEDDEDYHQPEESIYKEVFYGFYRNFIHRLSDLYFRSKSVSIFAKSILISCTIITFAFIYVSINHYDLQGNKNIYDLSFMDQPINYSPFHKIILPFLNELYPEYSGGLDNDDLFDPRLPPAALLLYIQNHLYLNQGKLKKDFSIPFSWEDWVDLDSKLKYDDQYLLNWLNIHSDDFMNQISDLKELNCETFALIYGCEGNINFKNKCLNLEESFEGYPYKFKITGPTDTKIKESGRILYGGSYLKFNMPPPERIYLLDVFGSEGEGSLMINVDRNKNINRKPIIRNKSILKKFIDWELELTNTDIKSFLKKGWDIESLRERTSMFLKKFNVEKIISANKHYEEINEDETFLAVKDKTDDDVMRVSKWEFTDFLWEEETFLDNLSKLSNTDNVNNYDYILNERLEELENIRVTRGYHPKYLFEAELYGTSVGSHFDWRFISSSLILNDYRQSIIHRLTRTWLRFCFKNGIKTFIAYGSMLGWIRNGLSLPWDGDIDAIITMESLNLLARNFNQTLIVDYSSKDGFQSAMSSYLLDINPAYYSRIKGDGNNIIDGRLIDISTGVYLDITALAWTKDYLEQVEMNVKLKKIVDKDFEMNEIFALEGNIYSVALIEQLRKIQDEKELVHCKNDNVYTIDELSVMIPSYFEGARAYFPHDYEKIIWRLYPKALTRITEPDHVYDKQFQLWVNVYDCPGLLKEFGNAIEWEDFEENNKTEALQKYKLESTHTKGSLNILEKGDREADEIKGDAENEQFGKCENAGVLKEYRLTSGYTKRHLQMLADGDWNNYELGRDTESKPLRIDEFFILYAASLGLSEEYLINLYAARPKNVQSNSSYLIESDSYGA